MKRRWRPVFIGAAAATVAVLVACNAIVGVEDVKLIAGIVDGGRVLGEESTFEPPPLVDGGPVSRPEVYQVALGEQHSCARSTQGTVKCWGDDLQGQTGAGLPTPNGFVDTPRSVEGIADAVDISSGRSHTCVARRSGGVSCWGYNFDGQLGNGKSGNRHLTPVNVASLTGVVLVAAGGNFSCAVRSSGSVACWGGNGGGQLGTGNEAASTTPTLIPNLQGVSAIAAGQAHACAVKRDGSVLCWGDGQNGQLGAGTASSSSSPVVVDQLPETAMIAASERSTCALTRAHAVYCWGANELGQLGNGAANTTANPRPIIVANLTDAIAIAAGRHHTCATRKTGAIVCWGAADSGQLGDGQTRDAGSTEAAFVKVLGIDTAVGVGAGGAHSCALMPLGSLLCWGANGRGQLGNGEKPDAGPTEATPVPVLAFP